MISTKARYALRVMIDLADNSGSGYVPLKDIANRQEISEKYLEVIIKMLVQGRIVKGLRGKGGGYMLTREPKDYPIGEVIELTEGPLAVVSCELPYTEPCPRMSDCITLPLWQGYSKLTHDYFYSITLEDVINGNYPNM